MSTYHHPDWSAYVRAAGLGLDALHARYVSHVYDRHFHDFYVMGVVERGAATFALARRTITCESACKKDPVSGVIGIQTGPHHEGLALASIVFGSRGLDVGRGDNRKDPTGVFQAG